MNSRNPFDCDRPSFSIGGPPWLAYDEFLYQFGTALIGAPHDAPQVGPGAALSLAEAFAWAKIKGRCKETPEIADPSDLASGIRL